MSTYKMPLIGLAALFTWTMVSWAPAHAEQQPVELEFKPDRLYEIAFFTVAPGKATELRDRYFSKVTPIVQKYGGGRLGTFTVNHIEHGPDDVATWGFFEWPSLEAKQSFDKDRKFQELRPIRDRLLQTLRIVYVQVKEPTRVAMRDDRMYEFYGGWINRARGAHLQDYFAVAGPWTAQRGVKFIGEFEIVGSPDDYHFLPDTLGFIEWPNKAVKEAWFASEEFKQVGYHRALAIDRLVVIESDFDFPKGP